MNSVTNLREAANLFSDDNLVWSDDLESFRKPLAELLTAMALKLTVKELSNIEPAITKLCSMVTACEDDLTIPSPIEEYKQQRG